MAPCWRVLLVTMIAVAVCHAAGGAQEAPAAVVYRAFFHNIAHLDLAATQEEAQGRSGSELRAYYRSKIGLSENEARALRTVAASCVAQLQEKDAEAKALIQKIRARTPGGKLASRAELPSLPPELARMQQERDEITQRHIDELAASLGAESFGKVDAFVKARYSSGFRSLPSRAEGGAGK